MEKLKFLFKGFGLPGLFYFFLYKVFYERLRAFKSSLEIAEWAMKTNSSLSKKNRFIRISHLPDLKEVSFMFRPFTSDSLVVKQHFFSKELSLIVAYFKNRAAPFRFMIDAGGNIGASACFMHGNFPEIKSLILEPSLSNLEVAKINLERQNSILWGKALWWRSETLNFDEGRSAWARRVSKTFTGRKVEGIELSEILQLNEFSNPDYIKIDIEGAEEEVFGKDTRLGELLATVACISVEPHSYSGKLLIESKLAAWGYRVEYSGELIIGFR